MISTTPTSSPAASPSPPRRDWQHGGGATAPIAGAGPGTIRTSLLAPAVVANAGLVMLLGGLIVVAAGTYVSQTVSTEAGSLSWLMGSGFGGLSIAVVGGFLYAGSWVTRLVHDSHAVHRQIAETLLALADVIAQTTGAKADMGSINVTVGDGTVVHRRDCPLVAWRPDLTPADDARPHLSTCRVCKPERDVDAWPTPSAEQPPGGAAQASGSDGGVRRRW